MIYKYTKCESVIAKILADSDMAEKDMRISDIREWIFEAIEKIGAPMLYVHKETPAIKMTDHQIPLPDDLVHLTAVAYSTNKESGFKPARTTDKQFREPKYKPKTAIINAGDGYDDNNLTVENDDTIIVIREEHHQPMRYKLPTAQCLFYSTGFAKYADDADDDITFFIKPGWIVLNKPTGYVKISYKALPTDERGYPLIPDTTSYQEAVYWYVMWKLNFPLFMKGKLGGKTNLSRDIYFYLQQQWNFYRNQAYAEAMMPTESDMRSIKNEWNKLLPDWDSDDYFFESNGRKQLNYNDYYHGW